MATMAAVPAISSSSTLRLSRPLIHQPRCSASAGILVVSMPLTRCPGPAFRLRCCWRDDRWARVIGVAEERKVDLELLGYEDESHTDRGRAPKLQVRSGRLYVCNLPRSCGISKLEKLFRPFGTIQSVEVSRNVETGVSKGCGFVTMSTISEAEAAIFALDGSDLEGREFRVFSVDMVPGRRNSKALNSPPKDMVFESPNEIFVGNLALSVTREDLRNHFSQFGTVINITLLNDRRGRGGTGRVYGFLSFSSPEELKDALSLNGTEFRGRLMVVRKA